MHTQEEIEESKLMLADSLRKLYNNKDFKNIILNGYLESGSVYLVKNFTKVPRQEDQIGLVEQIKSRSNLWKYLDSIEEEAISILNARAL